MYEIFTNPLSYGYACARVRGWKSKLMAEKEFGSLVDSDSFYGVIDILSKTGYGSQIQKELLDSGSEKLIAEIEKILWSSLSMEFMKLFAMLSKSDQMIIRHIFKSYDSKNLRIILIGRQKGGKWDSLLTNVLPIGLLDQERLKSLYEANTIKKFVGAFKGTLYYQVVVNYLNSLSVSARKQGKEFNQRDPKLLSDYAFLQAFCDILENSIHDTLMPVVPGNNQSVRKIVRNIRMYIDGLNYIKMVEGKQDGVEFRSISAFSCGTVPVSVLERQFGKDDMQKWSAVFPEELVQVFRGVPDPVELERRLKVFQLRRMASLLGEESSTLGNIVGYIFLKLSEFHNVTAILKGKRMGLSREYLRELIA